MCIHIWGVCPICGAIGELRLTKPCETRVPYLGSSSLTPTLAYPCCPHGMGQDEFVQFFCSPNMCEHGQQPAVQIKTITQLLDDMRRSCPSPAHIGVPFYAPWSPTDTVILFNALRNPVAIPLDVHHHDNIDHNTAAAVPQPPVAPQAPTSEGADQPRAPQDAGGAEEPRAPGSRWTDEENEALKWCYRNTNMTYAEMAVSSSVDDVQQFVPEIELTRDLISPRVRFLRFATAVGTRLRPRHTSSEPRSNWSS
jgi:hypothetical protein